MDCVGLPHTIIHYIYSYRWVWWTTLWAVHQSEHNLCLRPGWDIRGVKKKIAYFYLRYNDHLYICNPDSLLTRSIRNSECLGCSWWYSMQRADCLSWGCYCATSASLIPYFIPPNHIHTTSAMHDQHCHFCLCFESILCEEFLNKPCNLVVPQN